MKRYLWVLLLAACTAPTGEIAKTVKSNEKATQLKAKVSQEAVAPKAEKSNLGEVTVTETKSGSTEVPEKKVEETKTPENTYLGISKLNIAGLNIKNGEDIEIPNDHRFVLVFDKDGRVGWAKEDKDIMAEIKANPKEYTYEVYGDTVTVKKDGVDAFIFVLRQSQDVLYIIEDNTSK